MVVGIQFTVSRGITEFGMQTGVMAIGLISLLNHWVNFKPELEFKGDL